MLLAVSFVYSGWCAEEGGGRLRYQFEPHGGLCYLVANCALLFTSNDNFLSSNFILFTNC